MSPVRIEPRLTKIDEVVILEHERLVVQRGPDRLNDFLHLLLAARAPKNRPKPRPRGYFDRPVFDKASGPVSRADPLGRAHVAALIDDLDRVPSRPGATRRASSAVASASLRSVSPIGPLRARSGKPFLQSREAHDLDRAHRSRSSHRHLSQRFGSSTLMTLTIWNSRAPLRNRLAG